MYHNSNANGYVCGHHHRTVAAAISCQQKLDAADGFPANMYGSPYVIDEKTGEAITEEEYVAACESKGWQP